MALSFLLINKKYDNKTIWHTIYAGIGAYPNSHNLPKLSDNTAYALYTEKTGQILDLRPGGNFYDKKVFSNYAKVLRTEYMHILQTDPFILIRNAILNFFQTFSLGYFVDYPLWVSYLSALAGFIFCMLLLIKKQYLWIIAIAASTLTFTPYYPPIQAYMFGNYVLIVGAFINLLKQFSFFGKIEAKLEDVRTRFVAG